MSDKSQFEVTSTPSGTLAPTNLLKRKCACGQHTMGGAKCSACQKEISPVQRETRTSEHETRNFEEVPPIVHEVLRSPGQPLDAATRSFFEPRFGHDFSRVRVHTDSQARESARMVNALAYTVGRDVVFDSGQYAPATSAGQRLLAHELAHVVQQASVPAYGSVERMSMPGDSGELAADAVAEAALQNVPVNLTVTDKHPTLFRRVGSVRCPANVFGAPADPRAALEAADPLAVSLATQAADALATDATDVRGGIPATPSVTFQSYQDHFGLPVAAGRGFLNRLTGAVRPSLEIAASEELNILSRRFRFSARLFGQTIGYRCPGTATITLPGCGAGSCGDAFAFSCEGGPAIALCQPFWDELTTDETRAAALIHESMHMIFGGIGETTLRGSGRNFAVAGCYEFIINDMAGIDSFPVCPAVPTP